MYQYSDPERRLLQQRAIQFRGQVERFENKQLDSELFQQLRLRNGLYQERHAHMLRVAIPYGNLNSAQLHALADIATDYDKGYLHFTTRQNVQFNWPELKDVPTILSRLASVEMHAIQTSGSCIRNISCDHLAGASGDEIADPRPWCELIRQWANLHPEFNWLPRKFKFAVSGAREDRTVVQANDIGIRITEHNPESTRFAIYVGGGLGRTPVLGKLLHDDVPDSSLLAWLQAILRVYNESGRRDDKYKSRIKILVNDLGVAAFRQRVEDELQLSQAETPKLNRARLQALKADFQAPVSQARPAQTLQELSVNDPDYARWVEHNTLAHRDPAQRIVMISLKHPGRAPGNINARQMHALAELAEAYSLGEIRASHTQNLVLPHVEKSALYVLWRSLSEQGLATPNIDHLSDMISCPGFDYCSLANTTTLDISRQINQRFSQLDELYDLGPVSLNISGCVNSCAHHHVANIGILGVDKKGEQWYQVTLGGRTGNTTVLGKRLGRALSKTDIVDSISKIIQTYVSQRSDNERFIDCVERIGLQPFKETIYAHH